MSKQIGDYYIKRNNSRTDRKAANKAKVLKRRKARKDKRRQKRGY